MIKKLNSKKFFIFVPVFLGLVIMIALMVLNFAQIKALAKDLLESQGLVRKSTADILLDDQTLKIQFNILPSDQAQITQFIQNMGTTDNFLKGIELSLDSSTSAKLAQVLPLHVSLQFSPQRVDFVSKGPVALSSGVASQNYQIATGSGQLVSSISSLNNFNLKVTDPVVIVNEATASGKLQLSQKLLGLFPIMERIATIELAVKDNSLNGFINLK